MPKVSDMIQSKFLRKEDLDDDLIVTVKSVKLEDMPGDDNEQRWVVYFRELPKGLVLNVTTIRALESAFGNDTDQWLGGKVELYVDPAVTFKGKVVGGLRLRARKSKTAVLAALAGKPAQEDFNDEIPA